MNYIDYYQKELIQKTDRPAIAAKVSALIQLNAANIINLVKNRWRYGQSVEGSGIIGVYRSAEYSEFKQSLNSNAGGTVDLMLTGDLAAALSVKKINNTLFQVLSTDEKYAKLARQYGANEFGITTQQQDELLYEISQLVINQILNELF